MDSVDTQFIFKSNRKVVVRLTNMSDGTGEVLVKKVDASTLLGPDNRQVKRMVIERIVYAVNGMTVKLFWDHTPDIPIEVFAGQFEVNYINVGGLKDRSTPPYDGDGSILLSTQDHSNGDSYDITLYLRLKDQ